MTTTIPTTTTPAEIVWSWLDKPEDSHITDAVISESQKSVAELLAAMTETRAARAES